MGYIYIYICINAVEDGTTIAYFDRHNFSLNFGGPFTAQRKNLTTGPTKSSRCSQLKPRMTNYSPAVYEGLPKRASDTFTRRYVIFLSPLCSAYFVSMIFTKDSTCGESYDNFCAIFYIF